MGTLTSENDSPVIVRVETSLSNTLLLATDNNGERTWAVRGSDEVSLWRHDNDGIYKAFLIIAGDSLFNSKKQHGFSAAITWELNEEGDTFTSDDSPYTVSAEDPSSLYFVNPKRPLN